MIQNLEEQLVERAGSLLSRRGLRLNSFLVYRLTPTFQIPFKKLLHPRILGDLTQDLALVKKAVLRLPFARAEGNTLRLVYKDCHRRVIITGLLESVITRYLKNYPSRQPLRESDSLCTSLLCDSRDEAQNLCLYIRQCKGISEAKRQKIRTFQQARVRIAIEQGRLHSLLLEHFEARKLEKHFSRFMQSEGVRSEYSHDHFQHILERTALRPQEQSQPAEGLSCSSDRSSETNSNGHEEFKAGEKSEEAKTQEEEFEEREVPAVPTAKALPGTHCRRQSSGDSVLLGQFRSRLLAINSK